MNTKCAIYTFFKIQNKGTAEQSIPSQDEILQGNALLRNIYLCNIRRPNCFVKNQNIY